MLIDEAFSMFEKVGEASTYIGRDGSTTHCIFDVNKCQFQFSSYPFIFEKIENAPDLQIIWGNSIPK